MKKYVACVFVFAALCASARAHFIWIIPDKAEAGKVKIVFSDALDVDDAVSIDKIASTKLLALDATGKTTTVEWKKGEQALQASVPGKGPVAIGGTCLYGVLQRGEGKPFLLAYYPKMMLGAGAAAGAWDKLPLEIVSLGSDRFQVLFRGKPATGAEVVVHASPAGEKATLTTDDKGEFKTPTNAAGMYGIRARHIEAKAGEHDGKKYEEARHYATLVFQVGKAPGAGLPPLPTAVASLGAVADGGYLYVYGGHAGKTHTYDSKGVLGTFHRVKLVGGTKWEELPGGPILQGVNLAAHGGKIYRAGGMQPRNPPGEPADNHSLADVARFDPKVGRWENLPPLPAGRSSHDMVIVGDKLVVVGGWQMKGKGEKSVWHDTALILDLSARELKWESIPQPFERRALTATVVGTKVYVLGGLGPNGTANRVEILDVARREWSSGPAMPGKGKSVMAFSPAAGTVNGRVVVNTSAGPVYRLTETGTAWEKVGNAAKPRMVARLIPLDATTVLLVGGASRAGHVADLEIVTLAEKGEQVESER